MANRFSNSVQTSEDRIRAIQVEIDSVIEARVAQVMAACPNVPEDVVRNILNGRTGDCRCRAYLRLLEQG
jgi:hypothetical protein